MEVEAHLLARERFSRKRDAWWVEEAPTTIQELVALERQTRHHPNLGSRGSKKLEEIDIKVVCKIKSASKEFINSKEALGDKNKAWDQKERMVGVGIVVKNEQGLWDGEKILC
ncbi:hypothetical protein PVK06_035631 [Gossypium arboreum]|uniref:Uncharacterized protein n=1 Tax=Gossypium arboreum TaxID=29729 RepID=A0ABR0NIG6_GOSAR|nr:hypothetical protein PVK06_035631 [Gossypium arboreum]